MRLTFDKLGFKEGDVVELVSGDKSIYTDGVYTLFRNYGGTLVCSDSHRGYRNGVCASWRLTARKKKGYAKWISERFPTYNGVMEEAK